MEKLDILNPMDHYEDCKIRLNLRKALSTVYKNITQSTTLTM